jgi:hypothetical protein
MPFETWETAGVSQYFYYDKSINIRMSTWWICKKVETRFAKTVILDLQKG